MSCETSISVRKSQNVIVNENSSDKFSLRLFIKKSNVNSIESTVSIFLDNSQYSSQEIKIHYIHKKLMEIISILIQETVDPGYVTPIIDPKYTSSGVDNLSNILDSEANFISYLLSGESSSTPLRDAYIIYFGRKTYVTFLRITQHLLTLQNSTPDTVCDKAPRLYYELLEKCIFDLEIYYN